jgi:hypothetical protein
MWMQRGVGYDLYDSFTFSSSCFAIWWERKGGRTMIVCSVNILGHAGLTGSFWWRMDVDTPFAFLIFELMPYLT